MNPWYLAIEYPNINWSMNFVIHRYHSVR
jgi:hypothetical protein